MSLNLPESATEVVQRAKTDVQREAPDSSPFLRNSWLSALITGYANRVYDFYLQLLEAIKQSFPDTATEEFLERWAAIWGRNRIAATVANGNIVATGTATTVIPTGTNFASSDGKVYQSTSVATITASTVSVASITRSGTTATLTTTSDHNLASNAPGTIAGANETDYNLTDTEIQVTGLDTLTYQVSGAPSTLATGTITLSFTTANVPVESADSGASENQDADAPLTLQSPIAGVDNEAWVDFGALGGGTDQETDDELRVRLLERIQNPVAHFNANEIISKAKEVAGVTRVFVQTVTPVVGQVTVYFMRDNDTNPIPTASEVATVKAKIDEITPANTDTTDVFVLAPTGVSTDFTFTALTPSTTTMQDAISANLRQFFDERTTVGVDIDEDAYRSAIFNTVDTQTGDIISTFTLSAPSGDITIASGEIGVLGNITYP